MRGGKIAAAGTGARHLSRRADRPGYGPARGRNGPEIGCTVGGRIRSPPQAGMGRVRFSDLLEQPAPKRPHADPRPRRGAGPGDRGTADQPGYALPLSRQDVLSVLVL